MAANQPPLPLDIDDEAPPDEPPSDQPPSVQPPSVQPPSEFPAYGLDIPTDYRCPYCSYEWSGEPK